MDYCQTGKHWLRCSHMITEDLRNPRRPVAAGVRRGMVILFLLLLPLSLQARDFPEIEDWLHLAPAPPAVPQAEAALLIEPRTETVLFEKNADLVIPPASLTKIVTIHAARLLAEDAGIDLSAPAPVPAAAWARNMPAGSSLMFLGPDQEVTLWELFEGMAVSSGNDAAVATALRISGSVDGFMSRVNRLLRSDGFRVMEFHDPAGLSARNRITAREYGDFVVDYLQRWPESLERLHSLPLLTYPTAANYQRSAGRREPASRTAAAGASGGGSDTALRPMSGTPITQANRNGLLKSYPGADGIKTGFIGASGYNFVATAKRDDQRLVAIVLGIQAENHLEGAYIREAAARRLLDYGFENFERLSFNVPAVASPRIWKGTSRAVALERPDGVELMVPAGKAGEVSGRIDMPAEITAPVRAGQLLGEVRYTLGEETLERLEVRAGEAIPEGGILRRVWDSLVLLFRDLRDRLFSSPR